MASLSPSQPFRPNWPHWLRDDNRPVDREMVLVPARDKVVKTKHGLFRYSNGSVKYSALHAAKFRSDAEELARILREIVPHNQKVWVLSKLEQEFKNQLGWPGSWVRYEIPFKVFMSLFPRTFSLYGPQDELVRLWRASRTGVADSGEEAIMRLAMRCHAQAEAAANVANGPEGAPADLPLEEQELRWTRARAEYVPSTAPAQSGPPSRGGRRSRPNSAPAGRADARPRSASETIWEQAVASGSGGRPGDTGRPSSAPLCRYPPPSSLSAQLQPSGAAGTMMAHGTQKSCGPASWASSRPSSAKRQATSASSFRGGAGGPCLSASRDGRHCVACTVEAVVCYAC